MTKMLRTLLSATPLIAAMMLVADPAAARNTAFEKPSAPSAGKIAVR
jgi:hypothetical protein